jgi:hypothetical protein
LVFLFGWTRPWGLGTGRLVAAVLHGGTAQAGSSVVEHAVGANERLRPGVRAEKTGFAYQMHSPHEELVEILDCHFHGELTVQLDTDCVATGRRVIAKGGEEVAQPPFCRVDPLLEPEAYPVVVVAWVSQVLQRLGSIPLVGNLPTVK